MLALDVEVVPSPLFSMPIGSPSAFSAPRSGCSSPLSCATAAVSWSRTFCSSAADLPSYSWALPETIAATASEAPAPPNTPAPTAAANRGVAQPMNSSMRPWIAVRPVVTAVTALVVAVCAVVQLRAISCMPPDSAATRDWNVVALSPYQVPSTALAAPVCLPSMSASAVPALVNASPARVAPPVSPSSLARWSRIGWTSEEMKPATSTTKPFPRLRPGSCA